MMICIFNACENRVIKESNKERNLYYKIFAGCIFNELIPGYKERTIAFFELIKNKHVLLNCKVANVINLLMKDIENGQFYVDFDHHLYQEKSECDHGEFADILLGGEKAFVAIEAKFLTDWNFDKDIMRNNSRIISLSKDKNMSYLQVLLITKNKWENAKKKLNNEKSQYKMLKDNEESLKKDGFTVLLWEDVSEMLLQCYGHEILRPVQEYLKRQLI